MATKFLNIFIKSIIIISLICLSSPLLQINAQSEPPIDSLKDRQDYVRNLTTSKSSNSNDLNLESDQSLSPSEISGITLTWSKCDSCSNTPEVTINSDTITLGVSGRAEGDNQAISIHGASAEILSGSKYTINFDYDLYSWDSFNSMDYTGNKGYWDSFSVSVSDKPYWQLGLSDPITTSNLPGLGFKWGGSFWGYGKLQHTSGNKTVVVSGNPSINNYINVILDTQSTPYSDSLFPSWGTIKINSILVDTFNMNGNAAADLAKAVVGGKYLWGGQGWDWKTKVLVEPSQILSGYNYLVYDKTTQKSTIVFKDGLDCAGLILWAHNKAVGATSRFGGPVQLEGANKIYQYNSSPIDESQLQPGDLLFFDNEKDGYIDHVAMYVGGDDPAKTIVEAANPSSGIVYANKNTRKAAAEFVGFRRLKPVNLLSLKVQSHSPISLIVIDPNGNRIDASTYIDSQQEILREIPGILYYGVDDNLDDYVWAPALLSGTYTIKVVPKEGYNPGDTYDLEFEGASTLITLADDSKLSDIPTLGYFVGSTGSEVNTYPPITIYIPFIRK